MSPSRVQTFLEVGADGRQRRIERPLATETPCAIEINGIGYAVMMVTPANLEDFALGFCVAERLVDRPDQLRSAEVGEHDGAIRLRIMLDPDLGDRLFERVRHRASDASCGLCGIENLEQALRPLPALAPAPEIASEALFRALDAMRDHQPLNRASGAVHGALACDGDGQILLAREDVGRHNAFDKLIGAMQRTGQSWDGHFALLSSRCSYELVEKAALAGCSTLVTVSLPTSLALDRAAACGLRLVSLARPDSMLFADSDGH